MSRQTLKQKFDVKKHKIIRKLKRWRGRVLDRAGWYSSYSWKNKETCFIISTGRTGTTFLGRHFFPAFPGVTAHHEPQPDFFDLGNEVARGNLTADQVKYDISANRKWVLPEMDSANSPLYIESNQYLYSLVPALKEVFPEPKFIHIIRDGRDVVRSLFSRSFYSKTSNYDYIKGSDLKENPFADKWSDFSRFEKIAWYWQYKNKVIAEQLDKIDDSLTVYFEDIFNSQDNYPGMKKMLEFLSLEKKDWKQLMQNKKRSTKKYDLPHWTNWSEEQKFNFKEIAGDYLDKHNYNW